MVEFKLSKEPITKNPNCAYCGRVFNEKGISLQLAIDKKIIHFPLCQRCFEAIPSFEATVNLEQGFARINR